VFVTVFFFFFQKKGGGFSWGVLQVKVLVAGGRIDRGRMQLRWLLINLVAWKMC
jgi:hypothetical protein